MLSLTTVVAIAVTCSVIFLVSAVVITIVWVKIRQERVSLALARSRQGPYAPFPADTLTELSREEGSALRQYGQLPYGRPTEWGLLASRESLVQPADDKSSIPLLEKTRSFSLKHSMSKAKRQPKVSPAPKYPSPLTTLTEISERSSSPKTCVSKEGLVVSAVDGALELPTEITPRQTPEREDWQPSVDTTIRPISGVWPTTHRRERSGPLFPVFEDQYENFEPVATRVRGGSIASQTAGMVPDQPVPPPPPCAYPPNRFRLSKNDSLRFSSVSLDTSDSSILDDSRRTSANVEGSITSPALPPCPTFAPFSANDVGRMEYDRKSFAATNTAVTAPSVFPGAFPMREGQRLESDRASPRRSLTARSPSHSSERISPPPRRSESLSAKQSRGDLYMPYLDLDRIPPLNTTGRNSALLPHFSQVQRHSMHGSSLRSNDPFYYGSGTSHQGPHAPGRRASSFFSHEAALQISNGHPRPPLPSALKGGSGPRRGHRRQNCVRISIHPPITFGRPAFSPMVEEPEDVEEIDIRRSEIPDLSTCNVSRNSSVSALSTGRNSFQDLPMDRPHSRISQISEDGQTGVDGSPTKKRKQTQSDSNTAAEKALPEIVTSLPTTVGRDSLSHTPSPEKHSPAWIVSDYNGSPTKIENAPAPGSPRRSAVMGPRSQPGKTPRNSYQSIVPPENGKPERPPEGPPRNHSIKESPNRNSAQSLRRVKSEARDPFIPQTRQSQDQSQIQYQSQSPRNRASQPGNTQQHASRGPGSHKNTGTQNGAIVPIWEDEAGGLSRERCYTVSLVNEDQPPEFRAEMTPRAVERSKSRSGRMSRMSSYKNSQQGFTTPTRKTVGLGIAAATPGSLYDGDGFLKE